MRVIGVSSSMVAQMSPMSPQLLRSQDLDHFYNIIPFSILLQILASPAKNRKNRRF